MKITKLQLKQIIKEEILKVLDEIKPQFPEEEKSEEELACERRAAKTGEPWSFNRSTGKCEMLNEDESKE